MIGDRPESIDVMRAEADAASAEMGMAFDRLIDRLNLLGDRRAGELALGALTQVRNTMELQQALSVEALDLMQKLHAKQLKVLGSNPSDAARALLAAAGYPTR